MRLSSALYALADHWRARARSGAPPTPADLAALADDLATASLDAIILELELDAAPARAARAADAAGPRPGDEPADVLPMRAGPVSCVSNGHAAMPCAGTGAVVAP